MPLVVVINAENKGKQNRGSKTTSESRRFNFTRSVKQLKCGRICNRGCDAAGILVWARVGVLCGGCVAHSANRPES